MPLVSVIITTHNRSQLLPIAINSVLQQTFKDFELIIVDDASSDDTQKIIKNYEGNGYIRSLSIKNSKGANHARNQGIKISKGKYIAFLDDDDWWFPNKLKRQVQLLNSDENIAIAGCWFLKNNRVKQIPRQIPYRVLLSSNTIGNFSVVMFKKNDLLSFGGLDESLQNAQDIDCWLYLAKKGKIIVIPEILVYFNTELTNRITKNTTDYYKNYIEMVKHHENKMCFWTKQRHYSLVNYHTTPKEKKLLKFFKGLYYFISRLIDNVLIKINRFLIT